MINNKSAVVTLTMFSFIVITVFFVLIFSYFSFDYIKDTGEEKIAKKEILNSLISLRSELVTLVVYNDSNLTYSNELDEDIVINITTNILTGKKYTTNDLIYYSISSLDIDFCSNYEVYPNINTTYVFNGTCIYVVTD
jgi:hypothetical protein